MTLIGRALRQLAPQALTDDQRSRLEGAASEAAIPHRFRLDLLEAAHRAGGPTTVLRIGRVLTNPEVPPDPILFVFKNTTSVEQLIGKYQELCPALGTRNRVELVELGEHHAVVDHVCVDGSRPEVLESLHVCGLALVLLEYIGCRGLRVCFPLSEGPDAPVFADDRYEVPPQGRADRWRLQWTAVEPRSSLAGLDDYLLGDGVPPLEEVLTPDKRLAHLVGKDPARSWTIGAASKKLGTSTRSLQRALAQLGTTFTDVLWGARIEAASQLLREGRSVSEAGLMTGFSDTAHFSRRFRSAMGVTPSRYRLSVASRAEA